MTRKAATVSRFGSATIESDRVQALRADHPAVVDGRTLFPTTVTPSGKSPRFLVSGHNNPKLGKAVLKGPRTGWPIYQLSLEERATCPRSCLQWDVCYGNAMPFARRHTPDSDFERYLTAEVITLCREHPEGLLIRLHALGDFYSVEYVYLWARLIAEFPQLHVFGYTAHCIDAEDPASRKIAESIKFLTDGAWGRFAIRTSGGVEERSVTMVIDRPEDIGGFGSDIIICPAQTDQTAACATCGLCWADAARDKAVAFLKHGMKARGATQPEAVPPAVNDDFPKKVAGQAGQAALKAKARASGRKGPSKVQVAREAVWAAFEKGQHTHPNGMTSQDLMRATGLKYEQVTAACVWLDASGKAQWIYGRGQAKKILLPKDAKPAPVLSINQTRALGVMKRAAVLAKGLPNWHFQLYPSELTEWAGINPGSVGEVRDALIRKRVIEVVTPSDGRSPTTYRLLTGYEPTAEEIREARTPRPSAALPVEKPKAPAPAPAIQIRTKVALAPSADDLPDAPQDGAKPKTLVTRKPGQCAWPMNDPGPGRMDQTRYCCDPVMGKLQYCEAHARAMWPGKKVAA